MLTGAAHAKELRLFGLGLLFRQRIATCATRSGATAFSWPPGDSGPTW